MLERRVHDFGAAASSDRRLDDRQTQFRHTEASPLDDVDRFEVTPPEFGAVAASAVAVPWHRYLDEVGRKSSQAVPPCGRKSARGCLDAVTPDGGSNARGVGEGPVVNEVDTRSAPSPAAGSLTSYHGLVAEARPTGLCERDDSIVLAQELVEHAQLTLGRRGEVPS